MAEPFIGMIITVGYNFAPKGWAFCNGQLLSIAQNAALFSLLGTTYGGNGQTTFGLPDLRGRVPMHWGQGPGLTPRSLGEMSGSETVTLLTTNLPAHTHALNATTNASDTDTPGNTSALAAGGAYASAASNNTTLAPNVVGATGSNTPVANMQPYLTVSFVIALEGIYPSRS